MCAFWSSFAGIPTPREHDMREPFRLLSQFLLQRTKIQMKPSYSDLHVDVILVVHGQALP